MESSEELEIFKGKPKSYRRGFIEELKKLREEAKEEEGGTDDFLIGE